MKSFLNSLGGQCAFREFWAAPGGADVQSLLCESPKWGLWARRASIQEAGAGGSQNVGVNPEIFWPAVPGGRYLFADAARAEAAKMHQFEIVLWPLPHKYTANHYVLVEHLKRGYAAKWELEGWPKQAAGDQDSSDLTWLSNAQLTPGALLMEYPTTMLRRHGMTGGVQDSHMFQWAYTQSQGTSKISRIDELFFF